MDSYEGLLILGLMLAPPAAIAAFVLEHRRRARVGATTRPYTWGYFQGVNGLLFGCLGPVALVVALFDAEPLTASTVAGAMAMFAVWGLPGLFVIKRRRWAWIVNTIVTGNFVFWIINWIYGTNRWDEFAREAMGRQQVPSPGVAPA